jgi:hypothetical protein
MDGGDRGAPWPAWQWGRVAIIEVGSGGEGHVVRGGRNQWEVGRSWEEGTRGVRSSDGRLLRGGRRPVVGCWRGHVGGGGRGGEPGEKKSVPARPRRAQIRRLPLRDHRISAAATSAWETSGTHIGATDGRRTQVNSACNRYVAST